MGDSAGGGLTLSLLCLLRDMQLPLPGGGVLVSPWLDLTHSFPSILQNTATDIIPPYGFMHKPSVLWPPPSADEQSKIRSYTSVSAIKEREAIRKSSQSSSVSNLKKLLIPQSNGSETPSSRSDRSVPPSPLSPSSPAQRVAYEPNHPFLSEPRDAGHAFTEEPESVGDLQGYHEKDANSDGQKPSGRAGHEAEKEKQETTEPDEHIRISIDGKKVDLQEQIQFYALNSRRF
jgi:acetyl esterase/lipase